MLFLMYFVPEIFLSEVINHPTIKHNQLNGARKIKQIANLNQFAESEIVHNIN